MPQILVTGMSGTGKSTALRMLGLRRHRTVDTDTDQWSRWVRLPDGSSDWVWREDAMSALLDGSDRGTLFVAGCRSNQSRFYPCFDHVVLLSAPAEVLLARIDERTDNPYGKRPEERGLILEHLAVVEPLLRATCTVEIDASAAISQVVDQLEAIAFGSGA
ncbi:MAG: AAA family ATPase [Candidatus Dormibacteraeota bacterium]|uniref:AAA family ATPase n=1 Tax=Candidatus Amunia macphersoniae TaxID=3127014 RepID=A0A934NFA3_9BACT|nr:AAA family ATPase [Candidatus Dormibacteraeota bacterium]